MRYQEKCSEVKLRVEIGVGAVEISKKDCKRDMRKLSMSQLNEF